MYSKEERLPRHTCNEHITKNERIYISPAQVSLFSSNSFSQKPHHSNLQIFYDRILHDDVIKWKHFPRYWPFVREIHWSPVNSFHKGKRRGALMFSLICAWTNGWANNREAGNLRRHSAVYDVTLMFGNTFANIMPCVLFLYFSMIFIYIQIYSGRDNHGRALQGLRVLKFLCSMKIV